jgi:hypothetical protein
MFQIIFCIFFVGIEFVGHSFAVVAHFVFMKDATHLPGLAAHLPGLATHLPGLATHLPGLAAHLPGLAIAPHLPGLAAFSLA